MSCKTLPRRWNIEKSVHVKRYPASLLPINVGLQHSLLTSIFHPNQAILVEAAEPKEKVVQVFAEPQNCAVAYDYLCKSLLRVSLKRLYVEASSGPTDLTGCISLHAYGSASKCGWVFEVNLSQ